jgi:competence protein ComEC
VKLLTQPRQPFVGVATAAAAGIILADFFPLRPGAMAVTASIFMVAGVAALRWPMAISTLAMVGLGFFALHSFHIESTPGLRLAAQLGQRPRAIDATGFVISEPKIATSGFATFLCKLESVHFEGRNLATNATMLVRWSGTPEFGDELKFSGIAEPVAPPRNPGEFDMRSYLARRDVRQSLFVRYAEGGVLLRRGGGNPILRAAQESRAWMQSTLCRGLDDTPDVQAFLSGIVLGLRHQAPEDIEEPFQQTGTLHLFAVAGLHVGIVASLLWILAAVAQFPRKWAVAVIIPLLLFYAAVTGLHVSSIRAAVMSSILFGGFFFERKVFTFNSLAAAAFLTLCWDTNELFSAGFQLSFVVVGTIILLADPLFGFFRRCLAPDPFLPRALLRSPRSALQICFEWLYRGTSVSLAAWLGSLPLILWYFYLVTPVSLFANLIVVPVAFLVLAIALLSLLSALLSPWVSLVFNSANWCLARLILGFVHVCAQIPGGHFYVEHPHMPADADTRITVLDVGAGAAVHLRTQGADWLFDCGSERDYQRLIRDYLHAAGVNRLDGLVLSHGDSLHIGGAAPLLQDFTLRRLIDNSAPDRSVVHERLRRILQQRGTNPENMVMGEAFRLSRSVSAHVLYPPRAMSAAMTDDQTYVIQLFVEPSTQVLFMSDSGFATERKLLASGLNLRSHIVIKGQHHSGGSGAEEFLDAVRPQLIIATSRDFPDYERINDDWAEHVRTRGIKLFRQDETGAVELSIGEREWNARSYVTGETFRSTNR